MTHILVVDPNEAFSTLLVEELRRQDYNVEAAFTYDEASRIVKRQTFELALIDMAIEEPGALALALELRKRQPALRLVFIPLMGEDLSAEVASSISFQGVLPKPFFLPELPERIEQALAAPLERGQDSAAAADTPSEPEPEPLDMLQETIAATSAVAAPVDSGVPEVGNITSKLVAQHRRAIERVMRSLSQEVSADAVLMTVGDHLAASVGRLDAQEADAVAQAVIQGWLMASRMAQALDVAHERFEQSLSGDGYTLYALSVAGNTILSVIICNDVSLGLVRHRMRGATSEIAVICG